MERRAIYIPETKEVIAADTAYVAIEGEVDIGTFDHPDLTYPDSVVIYHAIRDLLYKRSAADPTQMAMYPNNICNMQEITILPVPTDGVVVEV